MSDIQLLRHDLEWAMQAIRTHDAVLILDLAGNIVAANQSYLRLCGYQRDEIVGRPVGILLDRFERCPERLGRMLDVSAGCDHQIHGLGQISKAGRHFRVDARICPIRDDQDDICLNVLFMSETVEEEGPLRAIAPKLPASGAEIIQLPASRPVPALADWALAAGYGGVTFRSSR